MADLLTCIETTRHICICIILSSLCKLSMNGLEGQADTHESLQQPCTMAFGELEDRQQLVDFWQ